MGEFGVWNYYLQTGDPRIIERMYEPIKRCLDQWSTERDGLLLDVCLGEAVVGGQVTPDTFIIDRESKNVKETMIGPKEQMIVSDGEQGTKLTDV